MPVSDIFKLAKNNAGKNPGTTVRGKNLLGDWIVDARSGVSSFDALVMGDSNTMFTDTPDTIGGIVDGLATAFETLQIPIYGSPIYWTGQRRFNAMGKYWQSISNAGYENDGISNPGGQAVIEMGQIDTDSDFSFFRTDLGYPTITASANSPRFSIAGTDGSYPNQPPAGGYIDEDFLKVEAGNLNQEDGTTRSLTAATTWPLIREEITGRFIFARRPSGGSWSHFYIRDSAFNENTSVSSPVSLSGSLGYGVHERTLIAYPAPLPIRTVSLAVTGTFAGVPATYSTKAGFIFWSMHVKNKIGVSTGPIYYRGSATTTDYKNDFVGQFNHNSNAKIKRYLEEVVNRQKSASPKNLGRVCIFIQGGRNTTPGATLNNRVDNWISDVSTCLRLFKETWLSLGYSLNNLCFVIMYSPIANNNNPEDVETTKKIMGLGTQIGVNTAIIDHAKNLPYSDYVSSSLWNVTGSANGQNTPDAHLTDLGYNTLCRRIISNFVLGFRNLVKRKK